MIAATSKVITKFQIIVTKTLVITMSVTIRNRLWVLSRFGEVGSLSKVVSNSYDSAVQYSASRKIPPSLFLDNTAGDYRTITTSR